MQRDARSLTWRRVHVQCVATLRVQFGNAICPGKIFSFSEIKKWQLYIHASFTFDVSDSFNILLQAYMLIYSLFHIWFLSHHSERVALDMPSALCLGWLQQTVSSPFTDSSANRKTQQRYQSLKRTPWLFVIINWSFFVDIRSYFAALISHWWLREGFKLIFKGLGVF